MKTTRYDSNDARTVLAGMVTDRTVLARISSKWDGEMFDVPWANLIGSWCINHLEKFGSQPNGQLQNLFTDWAQGTAAEKETITSVERFLEYLSDSYEVNPTEFILDVAGRYFNKVRTQRAMESAQENLDRGMVGDAHSELINIPKVELGVGSMIVPTDDFEAWRAAFDEERLRPLVEYPGDLGTLIGPVFTAGTFFAFMGMDKAGKSWWLEDFAVRALRNRLRVAYFEVGDLGQNDTLLRLGQRVCRLPERDEVVQLPIGFEEIEEDGRKQKVPIFKEQRLEGITPELGFKAIRKLCRGKPLLRISSHLNGTVNVRDLSSILKDWQREDFVPRVIVIDYADILAPPKGCKDPLEQIDQTWAQLRRLSQETHAVVMTATQVSAEAYSSNRLLSRKNFSGRKTKLAHVNGMIGLNVLGKDSERGTRRINWVVKRRGRWREGQYVTVAGCLPIGCPVVQSSF